MQNQDRSTAAIHDDERRRVRLHMPVDVRSASMAVIAVLTAVFMVKWAAEVLIPVTLGIMVSYALSPLIDRLERWHIHRALGAGIVMLGIVAGLTRMAYGLADDVGVLARRLPDAVGTVERLLVDNKFNADNPITVVARAAQRLEQAAASPASAPASQGRQVQKVQLERPGFNARDYLWTGTVGVLVLAGQGVMVLFIAFFLLVSGNAFRRKLVTLAGPRLSQKKLTLLALQEINTQIQHYMLVQLLTSVLVGLATWLALAWIGLDQAAVLGVASTVLNFIPYAGALAMTGVASILALIQFESIEVALSVAAISVAIHGIVGHLLMPWLTSRASRINPVVVFVGVLTWGWLWGVAGLLMGVPILMVIKAICERVDELKPISELLGS